MLSKVFHFDRNLVEELIVEHLDFSYDNLQLTGVGYFIFIIIQTASETSKVGHRNLSLIIMFEESLCNINILEIQWKEK